MLNPKNFAIDMATATASNYVAVSVTKKVKGADVRPPVVSTPVEMKNVTNENGSNVEIIDLSLVNVDRTYQRTEKPYVHKIAKEGTFDQNAVGYPVVNRRPDKSLFVIDGQQRIKALKLRKVTHWPCRVTNLATVEEEAELFGRLNGSEKTSSQVSQRDKFKALLAAKNAHALACVEAVKAGGMLLVWARHPIKEAHLDNDIVWRQIEHTSFVMGYAQAYGYELVTRACRIISESWPKSPDARRWTVVGAVFRLISDHPEIDDDRAIRQFRLMPAVSVDQYAKKEAKTSSVKASGATPFLLKLYNKGKRKKIGQEDKPSAG
jgi:hypothetical protein